MSLVATANANGVEPVAYLSACLENHRDLAHRPEHYLPWVYSKRASQAAQRSAPQPTASGRPPHPLSVPPPIRPPPPTAGPSPT
jgi:hypothetical protein